MCSSVDPLTRSQNKLSSHMRSARALLRGRLCTLSRHDLLCCGKTSTSSTTFYFRFPVERLAGGCQYFEAKAEVVVDD